MYTAVEMISIGLGFGKDFFFHKIKGGPKVLSPTGMDMSKF